MSFSTIHTLVGLQAMYDAASAGESLNLTEMAVGDGAGQPTTPDELQTALVREMYRAAINRVYKPDPSGDPRRFAAELVIPATEGGFVLREVGIFDADGALFAVGNLPETYKPMSSEGAYADTVVRLEFLATNADVVTLQIDPNITVATQQWVTNNVTAATVIPGGTTQQVLTKTSNVDGDYEWSDPTEANIVVNTIEEYQVLADAQTLVVLSTVTTFGLAVYINGTRLAQGAGANEWEPDPTDETILTLGQSYPAGTEIILVQNEPAASFPDALLRDQNLADVPDKPTARANLGVPSVNDLQNAVPSGAVMHFARQTAPSGWLIADGREVDRTTYAGLWNAIGTTFGDGNGVDTFNLPDLRGEFVRGWDDGRGVDQGRAFGSAQGGAAGPHQHNLKSPFDDFDGDDELYMTNGASGDPIARGLAMSGQDATRQKVETTDPLSGAAETRPRNIALLACIKT